MVGSDRKNSTNVRFLLALVVAASASACTSSHLAAGGPCGDRGVAICERFGPELRCECSERSEVRHALRSLDEPTWIGR